MSILEGVETPATQVATCCLQCGDPVLPGSPNAISHMQDADGWACSQACSDKLELGQHARSQALIGALFSELAGQSLLQ